MKALFLPNIITMKINFQTAVIIIIIIYYIEIAVILNTFKQKMVQIFGHRKGNEFGLFS